MTGKLKSKVPLIILMFMYIFAFKIIGIIDSAILVGSILFFVFLINKEYRDLVFKKLFQKDQIKFYFIIILLIIWSILVVTILKTNDYSYIKTLINLTIKMTIGNVFYAYYKFKGQEYNVFNHIIISFIAQSVLQWVFFIFPDLSTIFNIFRSEQMVLMQQKYSGIKGISLCGSGFFSLSSGYALILGLYFSKYNTIFKKNANKILMFLILASGVFFAGRTGYVGLFIIPFVLYKQKKLKITKDNIFKCFKYFLIGIIITSCAIVLTYRIDKFKKMYNYTFEMVVNVFNGKGLQTSSTNTLLDMYKVDIKESNLLIGDGKYTIIENGKESYYKNTDVGFFRRILYFGIIGYGICVCLQLEIIKNLNKYDKKIFWIILGFLFVLELKGEIIGINILVNSILIMFSNSIEKLETGD